MVDITILSLAVGSLYSTAVIAYDELKGRGEAKKKRLQQEALERQEQKSRLQKGRERQLASFRKLSVVVDVRYGNGKKAGFEHYLLQAFVRNGVSVVSLSENDRQAILKGDLSSLKGALALVGEYDNCEDKCYWRLLGSGADGSCNIFGAGGTVKQSTWVDFASLIFDLCIYHFSCKE